MTTPMVQEAPRPGHVGSGSTPAHAPRARRPARLSTTTLERVLDPRTLGDHFDRLFRAAWALCGSREDAEDLVQDTYARVLARPRVVRNTFISKRRAAVRRPQGAGVEPEAIDLPDPRTGAQPPAAAEAREVFAEIAALPANYRDALVAIDVAGLSYKEAAKALRVREGTITSRLFRARSQVAKSLS